MGIHHHERSEYGNPFMELHTSMSGLVMHKATGELFFPNQEITASTVYLERTLDEMQSVFYDAQFLKLRDIHPQRVVHRIYRTIGDTEEIVRSGLKYDLTVIRPGDWNRQLPTTTGHYHRPIQGRNSPTPSPDFYQVLSGNVMAILQRETEKGTEILMLQPQAGDWVLIPGEYAHSVVNTGQEPAVFANICVRTPHLDYDPILRNRGMGVYVVRGEDNQPAIIRNRNYSKLASVRFTQSKPQIPGLEHLTHQESFFTLLNKHLDQLAFLADPDSLPQVFNPSPIQIIQ